MKLFNRKPPVRNNSGIFAQQKWTILIIIVVININSTHFRFALIVVAHNAVCDNEIANPYLFHGHSTWNLKYVIIQYIRPPF